MRPRQKVASIGSLERIDEEILRTSILELSARLRNRSLSPVELTRDSLARIEKLNPALNAFIAVTADLALAQAHQAEAEIGRGDWRGPLHGIPLGLKDIIDTAGIRTTAASSVFKDRVPQEDAEVVRRLKNAGAVLLGKQNLHEFAYGGSSVVSYYGAVHNPWSLSHIAGGSSGGSAAAVAAGLCCGAIGTDTSGSIREPAALCGVVGLKPTSGRVSARGVIPLSLSLDHVGPIGGSVADVAAILQAIAGFDPDDPTSADVPVEDYVAVLDEGPKALRIGVPRCFFYDHIDPEVASAVDNALAAIAGMGHELRACELPVPTDRALQSAEAYSYHAGFAARAPELYQPETLRRIQAGANISAEDVREQREELKQIRREIVHVFENLDLLVTPTTPVAAPAISELTKDPDRLRVRELELLRNTRPFNVWGLPAISLPCGFTAAGLPLSLQISGPPWQEARVLQLAYAYEQATDWHKRQPPINFH